MTDLQANEALKRENAILRASLDRLIERCKFYGLIDEWNQEKEPHAADSGTISLSDEDLFHID